MSQGLTTAADISLCIDVTGSMHPVLERVKASALSLHEDIVAKLAEKDRVVNELRIQVVAYRDVDYNDCPAFEVSGWFNLPDQVSEFNAFVSGLRADGGGDEPESGLDALSIALNSDWTSNCDKQRHIVVLWTDATSKPLSGGVGAGGSVPTQLSDRLVGSIDELTDLWNDPQGARLKQSARRLLLYGPDCDDWNMLSEDWDEVLMFPSRAGEGLSEHDYDAILEVFAASIA